MIIKFGTVLQKNNMQKKKLVRDFVMYDAKYNPKLSKECKFVLSAIGKKRRL